MVHLYVATWQDLTTKKILNVELGVLTEQILQGKIVRFFVSQRTQSS